ncbi:hypothetical protein J5N97_017815 [Dioscorea zingiberensis]|uniref:DCD domain-containing protein n=1 Tax=Dioscorea zingiberensis TaxID=325984 RepID=A0A9D5CPU5_9LILI|nr:hypothetical protein J5N97_017815 [Dioscorea zingiberensis]
MEHDLESNSFEQDSTIVGAIFMSNRATKKECMKRGLFGLPHSQASFVNKLKAGMLLFLFEHEQRKLFGVFEATSDGAMNIIPNAFRSSGTSFPAQIFFKRIWTCKPLCESEFGDCIEENYYTPNKFHFGLSFAQVSRLLQLFSSKKINLGDEQNLISKSSVFKTKVSGKGKLLDTAEHDMADGFHSFKNPSSYSHNAKLPMYYDYPPTSEDPTAFVKHEHRFCPSVPCAADVELSNFSLSTTQIDGVRGRSFPVSHFRDHDYYDVFPGSVGKQSSTTAGSSGHSAAHEFAAHARPPPVMSGPYFSSHSSSSNQKLEGTNFLSNDCHNLDVSSRGINDSLSIPVYEPLSGYLPSDDYQSLNFSNSHRTLEGLSNPVYEPSGAALGLMSSVDNSNVQDHNNISFTTSPNHVSAPGFFVTNAERMSGLTLSPSKLHYYPLATQSEDFSSGQWQRQFSPSGDYIPLSIDEKLPRNMGHPTFLSSPKVEASDMEYFNSSYSLQENDYERENETLRHFNPSPSNKYHSSYAKSFYPDAFRKTSVFSRLSRNPLQHEQVGVHMIDNGVTLNHLMKLMSQRKKQWNKKKAPRRSFQHDDEQLECVSEMDPSETASLVLLQSDDEASTEEKIDVPFFNFKRRSDTCKVEHEDRINCDNTADKGKHKRRRLVRPSFDEDEQPCGKENIHSKRLSQRMVGIEALETNGQDNNTQIGDSSVTSYVDNRNGASYPEASLGSLGFAKSEKNAFELKDICDAHRTDEKDLVVSDGTVKIFSVESDIPSQTATTLKLGEETDEKFDALANESSVVLVHRKCIALKSDEVQMGNVKISDLGSEKILVKVYDECPQEASGNVNGGEEEPESHLVSHGNLLVPSDAKNGNNSEDGGQKNDMKVDESAVSISKASDAGSAGASVDNAEAQKDKVVDTIFAVGNEDSSMCDQKFEGKNNGGPSTNAASSKFDEDSSMCDKKFEGKDNGGPSTNAASSKFDSEDFLLLEVNPDMN